MLRSGTFNRQHIRELALAQVQRFRDALHAEIQRIFDLHGLKLKAEVYFREHFVYKMGL